MPDAVNAGNPLSYLGVDAVAPPNVIKAQRVPTNADRRYKIGTIWIDQQTNAVFVLTSVVATIPNWETMGSATGAVASLSGDGGGRVSPVGGNIDIAGTATGAIDFTSAGAGQITSNVRVDGLTITVNGSNQLVSAASGANITPDSGVNITTSTYSFGSSGTGLTTTGTAANALTIDNQRYITKYTVGPDRQYTTINLALAAAVADGASAANPAYIWVTPGTYIEDIVMADGIYIVTELTAPNARPVIIQGSVTFPASTTSVLTNIAVIPASGNPALIVPSGAIRFVYLQNVYVVTQGGGLALDTNPGTSLFAYNSTFIGSGGDVIDLTGGSQTFTNCVFNQGLNTDRFDVNGNAGPVFNFCVFSGEFDISSTSEVIFNNCLCEMPEVWAQPFIDLTNFASNVSIANSSVRAGGTNWITGIAGSSLSLGNITILGAATIIDPNITISSRVMQPYATTSDVGYAKFTAGEFTVDSTGLVALVGGPTGFQWNQVPGTSLLMTSFNGYLANNNTQTTLSLPSSSSVGDVIEVVSSEGNTGGIIVGQSAGQSIVFGNQTTTVGAGGSLTGTSQYDSVKLVCTVANLKWQVIHSIGNFTVV